MKLARRNQKPYNDRMRPNTSPLRPDTKKSRHSERGNALWFILIAIVLIGLLTAVLSRSGSNVDQTGSVEQQRIKISQMMRYVKGLETAVQTMKMTGISENDLSFYQDLNNDGNDSSSPDAGEYYNANCTSNNCLIFHVEGGGITPQDPPSGISTSGADWKYVATNNVLNVGTDAADLILVLEDINDSYCTQINRVLDVTQGADDADIDFTDFDGSYSDTETIDNSGGQSAGCQSSGGNNFFYQVLVVR